MEEKFHSSQLISKEKIRRLSEQNDSNALVRFTIMFSLFIASIFFVVFTWERAIIYIILSQIIFGTFFCSIFAFLHEAVHGTAFKTKALNKYCALLAGFAQIYPPSLFKELHFTHHRYTHIPGKDPEISLGAKPGPYILQNLGIYTAWITGFPVFSFKVMMLIAGLFGMPSFARKHLFPFVSKKNLFSIFIQCFVYCIGYAFLIYLAFNGMAQLIALGLGLIIGHCFLALYQSMEHNGLPYEGDVLNKTRSIRSSKLLKLIMWNMPYHAEHHAYPSVPFHALPKLHQELKSELIHQDESPFDFHTNQVAKFLNIKK